MEHISKAEEKKRIEADNRMKAIRDKYITSNFEKTYTKQITETKPKLIIRYDEYTDSPRTWTKLGYFVTVDRNYKSPDNNETLQNIIKEGGNIANSQLEHIDFIKKEYQKNTDEKVLAIYPITKYEHSSVSYRLGTFKGFDFSNNGFYVVTDKTQKETGTKKKDFEKVIADELKNYTQWANGEVYGFILFDENGEHLDSCGGFYNIDDIKEYLPDEWKNENLSDYLKY